MERTADVLATVAALPDRPFVVGFAAETESVEQHARGKLLKKNLDMIAANEVGHDKAFDCEDNQLDRVVAQRPPRAGQGAEADPGAPAGGPDRGIVRGGESGLAHARGSALA